MEAPFLSLNRARFGVSFSLEGRLGMIGEINTRLGSFVSTTTNTIIKIVAI